MSLQQTWAERCIEGATRPQPMPIQSANCSIGGNSPTQVQGIIENTPGSTLLNRPLGGVRKMAGAWSKTGKSENPYEWINARDLSALGAYYGYGPTGVDR